MKILLIDPPFQRFMNFYRYYYPLGLAYIAAELASKQHIVEIFDAEHAPEAETANWLQAADNYSEYIAGLQNDKHPIWLQIQEKIKEFAPDIVGISMLTVKVKSAYKIATITKEIDPNITVVVGADHPTIFPDEVARMPCVDFVVRGEGEYTFSELISCLERGDKSELAAIKGISYCRNGKIVHNSERELISNLDDLPFPGIRHLSKLETYRPTDLGVILTTRGCPFGCSFCGVSSIWTRRIRYRSIRNVVAEIEHLKSNFGTDYISFRDASFTLNRERILFLCEELIQKRIKINWECLTRSDILDEELILSMQRAGCTTIRIGIESGSQELLNHMNKSLDLNSVRSTAKLLKKHGLYWSAYFLFGTPSETRETILETLKFIQEIEPPFTTMARYAPIPGTKMYQELVDGGLINKSIDWSYESNQRLDSNYVKSIPTNEFEELMRFVASSIAQWNLVNSEKFGAKDKRLK